LVGELVMSLPAQLLFLSVSRKIRTSWTYIMCTYDYTT
jgi:hypothetical protein